MAGIGWKAYVADRNGVRVVQNVSPLVIQTVGTDNNRWCRSRGNGGWPGGWFRC